MPSYKLTFYNGKGRGEPLRYMFALSGTDYEDHRIDLEKWSDLKPKFEFGQVPVLYIDGVEYGQSRALCRHLARQFGLYGSNDHDRLLIDIVCDTADDLWPVGMHTIYKAEEAKKAELRETFKTGDALKQMAKIEKLLKKNKDGAGWFVGDDITLADVVVFNMIYDFLPYILKMKEGEFDLKDQDVLKAFIERFKSSAKIADWMKKRPLTPF